ncbi:MAG: Rieske 2Fe-2S domain-containing protein [Acidimicrobiia bacterium]|nr:Rieske 2Fe-2S domain-containing protein [Acidimicrobiia bacterium]NNF65550.1 Rieske 2Fe-2S domain-containing protein [Acidimicrobiia bacterium]
MNTTQIFIVAIAAVAVLAFVSIFAVAGRREKQPESTGRLSRKARARDRARTRRVGSVDAADVAAGDVLVAEHPEPVKDPLLERTTITKDEYDVTRRQFLNRSLVGIFGIFLAQFAIAGLAFFWPKLKGGFGAKIDVGSVQDIVDAINQPDGTLVPVFLPAAQSWVTTFDADIEGSSFEGLPVVAGGVMALWQRCVHLGCRVPECIPSQGFECPCHGSKYNFHGEYFDGPAPRNLDRFVIEVNANGNLIIDTGQVIQTPRASVKTIAYPQGPTCN